MLVIGFDLGTVTGVAAGMAQPNVAPSTWTWNLEDGGHGHPARFACFQVCLQNYLTFVSKQNHFTFAARRTDIAVFYEKPLTFGAMVSMANQPSGATTNDNTITITRGLVGILEAIAFNHGIRKIEAIDVHAARKFLTRKAKASKNDVAERCTRLGWKCINHNESDACAVWAAGCAIAAPQLAATLLPSAR